MERCTNAVDKSGEIHQQLAEEKNMCQKKLTEQTEKSQFDMIAREQKIIDDMTLQCEQEKEALLDGF